MAELALSDSSQGDRSDKAFVRAQHTSYRTDFLMKNRQFWFNNSKLLERSLAKGNELAPQKIKARLIAIPPGDRSWKSNLFRLARFNWSIPTSNGFGRRLRFLVWDDYHDALIGIIGLTDPVFNMRARDEAIGWTGADREERLVSVLDAYALGSLPPYSRVLGGKFVASMLFNTEIQEHFHERYGSSRGLISGAIKSPKLAMITTTSVLGRSSIYNRLRLGDRKILESVGYTSGFGHFHFSEDLFSSLRALVLSEFPEKANSFSFGQGPNWKIRVIRDALRILGVDQKLLNHGFKREIFLSRLYSNTDQFLCGDEELSENRAVPTESLSEMALQRWVIPRSNWDKDYLKFDKSQLINSLSEELESVG